MVTRLLARARRLTASAPGPQGEPTSTGSPIARCDDRAVTTVHGRVRSVTVRPGDGVATFEAVLDDGTDSVTLIWLGRHRIAGIEAGRELTVHGRIGRRRGERVLYNPRYDLA